MPDRDSLRSQYDIVKKLCSQHPRSDAARKAILRLALSSLQFLNSNANQIELVSEVPGKNYISYELNGIVARPANLELFLSNEAIFSNLAKQWLKNQLRYNATGRFFYTLALAPCLVMELFDRQNKKGPATYFECLIGHVFSSLLGINPEKRATLQLPDRSARLTMDFLFKGNQARPGIHLPVKMSTRERVVQAWSHQRLLDSAFGEGAYRGIMVLFSETKMDSRSHKVIEICVPDQWLIYQIHLAKMETIYYMDTPGKYLELTNNYPEVIRIKSFAQLFPK